MKVSNGGFAEACSSWLSSLSHCCAPLASCFDEEPRRCKSQSTAAAAISWPLGRASDQDLLIGQDDEKQLPAPVVYDPPAFQPQPVADPETVSQSSTGWKHGATATKKSRRLGLASFLTRSRFGSDASRRPLISAPTDFRHVHSGSFQFPTQDEEYSHLRHPRNPRPSSFRPLELSIYSGDNHVSPIMPHFEPGRNLVTPPPAYLPDRPEDNQQLLRQRSSSSLLSFHIPRRQLSEGSPLTIREDAPPRIPPRAPGRARAYTSPEMDTIKERVASAMIEMEKLQKQIDDVMERQSIYANSSRPSTAHSMARTIPDLEPMPSIPALPPAAPSFAERLNSDIDRPQTAPMRSPHEPSTPHEQASPSRRSPVVRHEHPLPPPLPLVLRPPLRKKKSFSRVSNWLFPGPEPERDLSLDSVTNLPRPVKGHEGFYQCVATESGPRRQSFESINTVSTWYTDDEDRTVRTAWSPESTPVAKQEEPLIERSATFGKNNGRSGRSGVGVAF